MTTDAELDLLDRLAALTAEALLHDQREAALATLSRVQNAARFHAETLRRMR